MDRQHRLLRAAFVIILIGYFLEWLPHSAAGLSIMGQELGEWVKFVPEVKNGQVNFGRGLFFVQPWTLAMMLAAWTLPWPNRRVQTWFVRIIALLTSLLIFPPFEVIRFEGPEQWLLRILMILSVTTFVFVAPIVSRRSGQSVQGIASAIFVVLGVAGAILPVLAYLDVRASIGTLLGAPAGLGLGIWVNVAGNLMVCTLGLRYFVGSNSNLLDSKAQET